MKKIKGLIIFIFVAVLSLAACAQGNESGVSPQVGDSDSSVSVQIASLQIQGAKTEFELGEEFSLGALTVYRVDESGNKLKLEDNQYEVDSSEFDKNKSGKYTIIISVHNSEITVDYEVTVKADAEEDKWSSDLWI